MKKEQITLKDLNDFYPTIEQLVIDKIENSNLELDDKQYKLVKEQMIKDQLSLEMKNPKELKKKLNK